MKFHDAISQLWVQSGLDTDFFNPQAFPWLLDLARIHGLPTCFKPCLQQLATKRQLSTEEDLLEAIKLAKLFQHSVMNGLHGRFGNIERRAEPMCAVPGRKSPDPTDYFYSHLKKNEKEIAQHPLFTELVRTIFAAEFGSRFLPAEVAETKSEADEKSTWKKDRQLERMKRRSILSTSHTD